MSSLISLPYLVLILLVVLTLSSLTLYSALFILRYIDNKKPLRLVSIFLLLSITIVETAVLRSAYLETFFHKHISDSVNWPWIWHVIVIVILFVYAIIGIINEAKYRHSHFVKSSIKEAIDSMPVGLCFANLDGKLVLANRQMYEFAERLTGIDHLNIARFLELVENSEELNGNQKIDIFENSTQDIYTFKMSDGQVMQITKERVDIVNEPHIQILVTDISVQHNLYKEIYNTNDALIKQRQEMRLLANKLIQNNHEEELLNYKIKVHNDFGHMILSTGQILSADETDEYDRCAREWIELVNRFSNMDAEKKKNDDELLKEILNVSEQIGCKVLYEKPLPEDIVRMSIVRQAIREAIINAVRHGGAKEVSITHKLLDKKIEIYISNNGSCPKGEISFSGGLKNLYDKIYGQGGDMTVEVKDTFTLKITLDIYAS